MSSPEHKALIWNLIKKVKVGMLTTRADDNKKSLRGRPMSLIQEAYDGTLYFFTTKSSSKVFEVEHEKNEVCVTFADPSNKIYVSLSGHAALSQDKELIDKYWNDEVGAWFPKGKMDPEAAILAIKVYKGEHWNTDENKLIQLFEFTKAKLSDEVPDVGEHEKFGK